MTDSTLRIEAKFKNAHLYNAIVEASVPLSVNVRLAALQAAGPVKSFCEFYELHLDHVYKLINLRIGPLITYGGKHPKQKLRPMCQRLAEILDHPVDWLFPADLYSIEWPRMVAREVSAHRFISLAAARSDKQLALPASQEDTVMQEELRDMISAALDTITPRERHVLSMRFGLDGEDEHTLGQVGKQLGVGIERIRQIEAKAIRKLRHPSRSRRLLAASELSY